MTQQIMTQSKKMNKLQLNENLEMGDLKRLVHDELHIDEYKSKMGDDADVCVVSFKVAGKEPAIDLVSFVEKGYDYVLDADVSSGEKEGGDYLVFVELDRTPELPKQIVEIMQDLMNLTEQELSDWRVRYQKSLIDYDLTEESLADIIPLTPKVYNKKYKKDQDSDKELDALKTAAGVDVTTAAPKNEFTESLRIAAGLR
jgi:hypothetical protein